MVEKDSPIPLYYQLKEVLKKRIIDRELKPHDFLPSDNELKEEFELSIVTIKRALDELEKENIIYRKQGKGTFVSNIPTLSNIAEKTLGFIFYKERETFSLNEYYAELFENVQKFVLKRNHNIFFFSVLDSNKMTLSEMIKSGEIRGALLIGTEYLDGIDDNLPIVVLDLPSKRYDCVIANNIEGASSATKYLISLGHEKIGYISWLKDLPNCYWSNSLERIKGYKEALEDNGIEFDEKLIKGILGESQIDSIVDEFINSNVTAILTFTDNIGVITQKKILLKGLRVPDDISVVGFGDTSLTRYSTPTLSSVRIDRESIARYAVERLFEKNKRSQLHKTDFSAYRVSDKGIL